MQHFAIIGDPVEHSLSPALHQYLFDQFDISASYDKIHVRNQNDLKDVIWRLRSGKLSGINITAPWKSAIIPRLDELTDAARSVHAVNTVLPRDGILAGHNTDLTGFRLTLRKLLGGNHPESVAIIGAGGSAASVLAVCMKEKFENIRLYNRTRENATTMLERLGTNTTSSVSVHELTAESIDRMYLETDLVINTLPEQARKLFHPDSVPVLMRTGWYYDILYHTDPNGYRAYLAGEHVRTMDGLDMLILQGIASEEYWFNRSLLDRVDLIDLRGHILKMNEAN